MKVIAISILFLLCSACADQRDDVPAGTPVEVNISVGGVENYEDAATRAAGIEPQTFVCGKEGERLVKVTLTPEASATRGTDTCSAATRALPEGMRFRLLAKNHATGALAGYVDYYYSPFGTIALDGKQLLLPAGATYVFGAYSYGNNSPITDAPAVSVGNIATGTDLLVWQSDPTALSGPLNLQIVFRHLGAQLSLRLNATNMGVMTSCLAYFFEMPATATWTLGQPVVVGGGGGAQQVMWPELWDPFLVTSRPATVLPQTNTDLHINMSSLYGDGFAFAERVVTLPGVTLLPGVSYVAEITLTNDDESGDGEVEVTVNPLGAAPETRANCYIVLPGKEYLLHALYEGNGISWDGSVATPATRVGTTVPGTPAGAKLVWQSAPGLITNVTFSAGAIRLTTNPARTQLWNSASELVEPLGGNAVVAVTAADGTVLWSWHLWVVDSEATKATIEAGAGDGNQYMDRALGAYGNSIESKVLAYGMCYQWGRKDPFPQSCQFSANREPTLYDAGGGTMQVLQAVGWGGPLLDDTLWGNISAAANVKTRYDPCPAGWKVPPENRYRSASKASGPWSAEGKGRTFSALGGWFPASGNRDGSDGSLFNVGSYGSYWTSTPYSAYGRYLFFSSSSVYPTFSDLRAHGYVVRCAVEN